MALDKLNDGISWASGLATSVVGLAATLAVVNMLAAPAWGAVLALANACSAAVSANGTGLLTAFGVLGLSKYLKS
jgi:hypothetical protein